MRKKKAGVSSGQPHLYSSNRWHFRGNRRRLEGNRRQLEGNRQKKTVGDKVLLGQDHIF